MLFTVYDLKGECFEVAPHIAKVLIIEHGWGITPLKKEETNTSNEVNQQIEEASVILSSKNKPE